MRGYVYRLAPDHPRQHNGYVFEHILVAEEKIGRPLLLNESVHHIDGNKGNNSPENIRVMDKSDHQSLHTRGKRRDAKGRFLKEREVATLH